MKRLSKILLVAISLIFILSGQVFAEGTWIVYTAGGITIRDVAIQDEFVWCVGQGGVVRWDTRGMTYDKFTSVHGLGNNWIQTIAIGSDGDIWVGTYKGGISRFDGHVWETFGETDGINVNGINDLAVDENGVVWAGTSNGAYCFEDGQWSKFTQNYTLSTEFVRSIAFAPDGAIWFGGAENGVFRYDGEEIINFTTDDGLADNNVISLAVDSDGVVWALTSVTSLSRYVNGTWEVLARGAGPSPGVMTRGSLAIDHDGVVLAGTKEGMFRCDGVTVESFETDDSDAPETAAIFAIGGDGTIWAGSYTGGLHRFDGEGWELFTTHDWLPSNTVYEMAVDSEDVMWLATGNGLSRHDGIAAMTFTSENSPLRGTTNSIVIGTNNEVWVGTPYGAYRYNEGIWDSFSSEDVLPYRAVFAIATGSEGEVWVSTSGHDVGETTYQYKALSCYNGTSWETFSLDDLPIHDPMITSITVGDDGVMWCGCANGAIRYDGETWEMFTKSDGLIGNNVLSIAVEQNGVAWFGIQGGLSRFDGTSWESYTTDIGLTGAQSDLVYSVFIDSDGAVWTVTKTADYQSGVYRYDGDKWELVTSSYMLNHSDPYHHCRQLYLIPYQNCNI